MEELVHIEKVAIIKALVEIMNADNDMHDVNKKELDYIEECARQFGLDNNYMKEVNEMLTLQALLIIRKLSCVQKQRIAKMMGEMMTVNAVIDTNYHKDRVYNTICEIADIPIKSNIENYIDCAFSPDYDSDGSDGYDSEDNYEEDFYYSEINYHEHYYDNDMTDEEAVMSALENGCGEYYGY